MKAILLAVLLWPLHSWSQVHFFDNDPATNFSPPPPKLTNDDLVVLEICGEWGSDVSESEVANYLNSHLELLDKINSSTNTHITVTDWTNIWTKKRGFRHIFCGEPNKSSEGKFSLGGLHFAARYLEAENKNWITLCDKNDINLCLNSVAEYDPLLGVYSLPVKFKFQSNEYQSKRVSGYSYFMHAKDILEEATLAYLIFSKKVRPNVNNSCIFETGIDQSEYPIHKSVAAMSSDAIVTFYAVLPGGEANSIKNYGSATSCRKNSMAQDIIHKDIRPMENVDYKIFDNGFYWVLAQCSKKSGIVFGYHPIREPALSGGNISSRPKDFSRVPELGKCQQESGEAYVNGKIINRGHLVPHNHFDQNIESVNSTYTVINMQPQEAKFNQTGAWKRTEEIVECLREEQDVWVYGGVLYEDKVNDYVKNNIKLQPHDIQIPDAFWKIVITAKGYDAWLMPNLESSISSGAKDRFRISIKELGEVLGDTLDDKFISSLNHSERLILDQNYIDCDAS